MKINKTVILLAFGILILAGLVNSNIFGLNWKFLEKYVTVKLPGSSVVNPVPFSEKVKVATEESVVITVVEKASPAVVTIGITATRNTGNFFQVDPFDFFSPFQQIPGGEEKIDQDIGSGFIISSDGLIVTNKHVVSETDASYRVIAKDDKTYSVEKIYRDPTNDLAILKIAASGLPTVELGDSSKIKVGQMAIAIGTALGEFRSTVTTGVISGMGRGITAGSLFEGYAERLDNVIQTDAAINPGNSGGPLLNSAGQVIGINTAVSSEGQNIGFALPINVVKDAVDNFNKTGQFNRPYLGVRYKIVTKDVAILNDVPEGAYIIEVVTGSPAEKAGLKVGDIIINIDSKRLKGENAELGKTIGTKKAGDIIKLIIWRSGKEQTVPVTLGTQG